MQNSLNVKKVMKEIKCKGGAKACKFDRSRQMVRDGYRFALRKASPCEDIFPAYVRHLKVDMRTKKSYIPQTQHLDCMVKNLCSRITEYLPLSPQSLPVKMPTMI